MSTCKDFPLFGTVVQTKEEQIRSLEISIEQLEGDIRPLAETVGRFRQQILELKSPFKVGDVIQWAAGQQTRKGKVTRIRHWVCGSPMWDVQIIRADGTPGSSVEVREYHKPTLVIKI